MPTFENQGYFNEYPPAYEDDLEAGFRPDPPAYEYALEAGFRPDPPSTPHMLTRPDSSVEGPRDNLAITICMCLCCNWMVGVCAIYHACKVRQMNNQGEITKARAYAYVVKTLVIWSFVLGFIGSIIGLVFYYIVLPTLK